MWTLGGFNGIRKTGSARRTAARPDLPHFVGI
jgi:hypothetical protein